MIESPQPDLFTPDNYAYETSLPAYHSNKEGKAIQAEKVYQMVRRLGFTNLLQLSEMLNMPQSTVSGRVSDLKKAGKVMYLVADGKNVKYVWKGMMRKKIVAI